MRNASTTERQSCRYRQTSHRAPMVVFAALLLATAGCDSYPGDSASTPTEPQMSVTPPDSLAPLYEMDNPRRIPGRYIVRFRPSVTRNLDGFAEEMVDRQGGRVYRVFRSLRGFWGELPDEAIQGLRRHPDVAYVEADVAVPITSVGDTIQWYPRWPLDRVDQRSVTLDGRYEYSVVGSGVRIWVIDTGIDRNEADLSGRVDESWYVTIDGKDPYAPCHAHGTNVAKVAAGATFGVARGAVVHAARVDVNCDTGDLSTGAASFAFEFIADHSPRPAVVNYSAGRECGWLGCGQTVEDAARYARSQGVTVVVAAGNSGADACNVTPARVPELLTVGATNENDQRHVHPGWWESNYGSCLDLFAPVESSGGTSGAAPMVTGVAALHLQLFPGAAPSQVEAAILSKTTDGELTNIGAGSPNRLLFSKQPPLITAILGPEVVGPWAACTWYASVSGGQPSYVHEWRRDGVVVGSATSYSVSPAGSSDFMLELVTTDGVGRTHWAAKNVRIDPNSLELLCSW